MHIQTVFGSGIASWLDALAALRITVFREFPYLYDGSAAYERNYLATYTDCADAIAVLLLDGEQVVGASTGLPMRAETDEFRAPLAAAGYDPERMFYCGESVLLPGYRGQGWYKHFFEQREAHARALGGLDHACFCAVIRPDDHPLRPDGYQPLDAIWQRFGYRREPGLETSYRWQDIDQPVETGHPMAYWVRTL